MSDTDQLPDAALLSDTGDAPREARVRGRPFVNGSPGGPGRPRGSRNETTRLLDRLATNRADAIVEQVIKRACEGDMRAAEIVLSRIWSRRPAPSEFHLPPIARPQDMVAAFAAVTDALAAGELTPAEAKVALASISAHGEALFRFNAASVIDVEPDRSSDG